ncbi:recombinase family protein [Mycobacterium avium]|uniref:recombinase family protein n=1 Tax=Mycobacterium avium TaxID=1764 RepID=UPI0015944372|nr:recombinase family protein [Mycobacterium avium]
MSEAELHFIRARLIAGQLSKARRGEPRMGLPVGLIYDPAGNIVLDPDSGVQQAIRQVFTLFARTGLARAVVQRFNADGLLLPVRVRTGARKGELAWMPLQHWRVLRTLHNPRHAGTFAYGRRRERLAANGKKTFDTLPREQSIALIPNSHPGYISWEQYETNQRLLLANATAHGEDRAAGPAREGTAMLQGLAICGGCGRRMTVRYHTRRGLEVPDYQCMNRCIQDGAQRCQTVPGAVVDDAVGKLLLDTSPRTRSKVGPPAGHGCDHGIRPPAKHFCSAAGSWAQRIFRNRRIVHGHRNVSPGGNVAISAVPAKNSTTRCSLVVPSEVLTLTGTLSWPENVSVRW